MRSPTINYKPIALGLFSIGIFFTAFQAATRWDEHHNWFTAFYQSSQKDLGYLTIENREVFNGYDFEQAEIVSTAKLDINNYDSVINLLASECKKISQKVSQKRILTIGNETKAGAPLLIHIETEYTKDSSEFCENKEISPPIPITAPNTEPFQLAFYFIAWRSAAPFLRTKLTKIGDSTFLIQSKKIMNYPLPFDRSIHYPDINKNNAVYREYIGALFDPNQFVRFDSAKMIKLFIDPIKDSKMRLPLEMEQHHKEFFRWLVP